LQATIPLRRPGTDLVPTDFGITGLLFEGGSIMTQISIFGGGVFNNPSFKSHMNNLYYPLDNMKKSVAILKASPDIDIQTMTYGQYQPVLSPRDVWPNGRGKFWMREMGWARVQLSEQLNRTPLSNDEPDVVPLTRCGLLDACIRKCFNSEPPIPMRVDIQDKPHDAPDPDQHHIELVWEYGNGPNQVPTLLKLTMFCPFIKSGPGGPGKGSDKAES
jgi:hypothetical protein